MEIRDRKVFRSGSVIGMTVKTPDHKRLGVIEELVVDIESGKVVYAVLGFGGYFGLGDKFFAVPWNEFKLVRDETEQYFELETSREQLKNLPGFSKSEWPGIANSDWDKQVDWAQFDPSDPSDMLQDRQALS